jgi:hypothetical protein
MVIGHSGFEDPTCRRRRCYHSSVNGPSMARTESKNSPKKNTVTVAPQHFAQTDWCTMAKREEDDLIILTADEAAAAEREMKMRTPTQEELAAKEARKAERAKKALERAKREAEKPETEPVKKQKVQKDPVEELKPVFLDIDVFKRPEPVEKPDRFLTNEELNAGYEAVMDFQIQGTMVYEPDQGTDTEMERQLEFAKTPFESIPNEAQSKPARFPVASVLGIQDLLNASKTCITGTQQQAEEATTKTLVFTTEGPVTGMACNSESKVRQYSVLFTGSAEYEYGVTLAEKIMHGCSALKEIRVLPIVEENRLSMNENSTGVRMFLTSIDSMKPDEWKRILDSTCDSNQYQDPIYNHSNQSGQTNRLTLWSKPPYNRSIMKFVRVDRETLGSPSSTPYLNKVRTDAAVPYLLQQIKDELVARVMEGVWIRYPEY